MKYTDEQKTTTSGRPITEETTQIDPRTGMQKDYIVLTEEERAKGFVRPLRTSYRHVGIRPQHPTRELTPDEHERLDRFRYVLYEEYPKSESCVTGRFWTEEQLKSGCGAVTIMGPALCETYARDPEFYSATFCIGCGKHLPVGEFVWEEDGQRVGS